MSQTDSSSSIADISQPGARGSYFGTAYVLGWRELVRFFRQRNRVIGALLQPIIFWLLFSEGLKQNDLGYAHFFPGTLVMILLFTAIFATISIIEDRREGFLQSVLVAPVERSAMVCGKVLGGALIAFLQGLFFMTLGWLWPGMQFSAGPLEIIQAIAMMLAIAVALTALGFALAWRMDSTHGFHAIMSVFLFPMWLLSGAFFPHDVGGILGWIVRLNPLTYGVAGLRQLLELQSEEGTLALTGLPGLPLCWGVTLGFAAVMFVLCWRMAGTRVTGDLL